MSHELPARLREIVGAEKVRADPAALVAFSIDATPLHRGRPEAVVFPSNSSEIATILAYATKERIPVVPRGAGTNLAAAAVPNGGIVLALTRLDALLEIDTENLVARCQPGVPTKALSEAVQAMGLLYPPDPGSQAVSTIGGNVATCAGGLRGLKYGVTRDYVLGLEVVLPTGETIRCGGKTVKDVAGYDLTRLFCGSEGTLGVITEITLRLVPAPAASRTGMAYFERLEDAGRAVSAVLAAAIVPATLEFLDATCITALESYAQVGLDTSMGALLIFGQDGAPGVTDDDMKAIADTCRAQGALDVRIAENDAEAEQILDARRSVLPSLSRLAPLTILEDVTVPRSRIADMVVQIESIARAHGLRIGTFGHAGDGNLHPTCVLDPKDAGEVERASVAFGKIFAAAVELGGTITGEHGVGLAKLPYLEAQLGAAQMALLRRIKTAFDPAGILNPGKLGS